MARGTECGTHVEQAHLGGDVALGVRRRVLQVDASSTPIRQHAVPLLRQPSGPLPQCLQREHRTGQRASGDTQREGGSSAQHAGTPSPTLDTQGPGDGDTASAAAVG
jgi:hypothetical protein